jgi:hypothetical protein
VGEVCQKVGNDHQVVGQVVLAIVEECPRVFVVVVELGEEYPVGVDRRNWVEQDEVVVVGVGYSIVGACHWQKL